MKLYLYLLLLSFALLGCKKDTHTVKADYAYLGGEIINPNSKFVVLTKDKTRIDTIRLDGRNRLIFKVDNLEKGMYTFNHGGEYQMLLLEPNDSILFRLNTLEFDESLVYSGIGSKKNNYFLNEYLQGEKEERHILKLCQQKPEVFVRHIDSMKASKIKKLKHFESKYGGSNLFKKIAYGNIDYSYYSSKEVYPFANYNRDKLAILNSLPDDFYSYRKHVNYNDTFFKDYNNYHKFLKRNLSNLSLKPHYGHRKETNNYNKNILCYNLDRLKLIDSLVNNTTIKDDLLHHFTLKYISRSDNEQNNDKILESYLNKASNELDKSVIMDYANALKKLKPGFKLPNVQVLDYNHKAHNINTLINQPTVITFWSNDLYSHFKDSHRELKKLKNKYSEVKFITINVDSWDIEKSKTTLKKCRFDCSNEYVFKNPETSKKALAIYPMTKVFIIDKHKNIVHSNANVFSRNFEKQLLGLINR